MSLPPNMIVVELELAIFLVWTCIPGMDLIVALLAFKTCMKKMGVGLPLGMR